MQDPKKINTNQSSLMTIEICKKCLQIFKRQQALRLLLQQMVQTKLFSYLEAKQVRVLAARCVEMKIRFKKAA